MTTEQIVTRSVFESVRQRLVVNGWLPDITALDIDNVTDTPAQSQQKMQQWQQQLKAIETSKGYAIELFNYGSNQAKGSKKVPRIVINNASFLPSGEIGNDPSVSYIKQGDYYIKEQAENVLSDLMIIIYAIGNTDEQMYNMNQLILKGLSRRGYLKKYDLDLPLFSGNFFSVLTDKGETEALEEGVMERYFVYSIKDLAEIEPELGDEQIAPINDINIETELE